MLNQDKALSQIRKMMVLANDAGATEGEVAAALGRIAHLMRTHNLSDAQVHRAARADGSIGVRININPEKMVALVAFQASTLDRWVLQLATCVADVAGCGCYRVRGTGQPTIRMYGMPADVAVAIELLSWVRESMLSATRAYCRELRQLFGPPVQTNGVEGRSFKDGFTIGIREKIDAAAKEAASKPENRVSLPVAGPGECSALVLVSDVDEARNNALAQVAASLGLRETRKRVQNVQRDADAFHNGRSKGHSVDMSKNVVQ